MSTLTTTLNNASEGKLLGVIFVKMFTEEQREIFNKWNFDSRALLTHDDVPG